MRCFVVRQGFLGFTGLVRSGKSFYLDALRVGYCLVKLSKKIEVLFCFQIGFFSHHFNRSNEGAEEMSYKLAR